MEMSILFYVNKTEKFAIIYGIYLNDMQITSWNLGGGEAAQLKQHNCFQEHSFQIHIQYFIHA